MAKMGIRHTYYGVFLDVGIEPETVEKECGKDFEEGRVMNRV